MKTELDEMLCTKYPKIFKNRHGDMRTTAMCWGLECGDGWYNILNQLCGNIQHHINESRKSKARAIRFNRALRRAKVGDKAGLINYFSFRGKVTDHTLKLVDSTIERGTYEIERDEVTQVVASQVKEKFGGLRFYYDGGDAYISGLVQMADSMSYVTCETCGNSGKMRGKGWLYTACDNHTSEEDILSDNIEDNTEEDNN